MANILNIARITDIMSIILNIDKKYNLDIISNLMLTSSDVNNSINICLPYIRETLVMDRHRKILDKLSGLDILSIGYIISREDLDNRVMSKIREIEISIYNLWRIKRLTHSETSSRFQSVKKMIIHFDSAVKVRSSTFVDLIFPNVIDLKLIGTKIPNIIMNNVRRLSIINSKIIDKMLAMMNKSKIEYLSLENIEFSQSCTDEILSSSNLKHLRISGRDNICEISSPIECLELINLHCYGYILSRDIPSLRKIIISDSTEFNFECKYYPHLESIILDKCSNFSIDIDEHKDSNLIVEIRECDNYDIEDRRT